MKIADIATLVNKRMGSGNTSTVDMLPYLDEDVDAINEELGINLPTFTDVYNNNFDKIVGEEVYTFTEANTENNYTRIPDAYVRNYICYSVAARILIDEDEPFEVYQPKLSHAAKWFSKLVGIFSDFMLEDTEAVTLNGDVDELVGETGDDTASGFYNPYGI